MSRRHRAARPARRRRRWCLSMVLVTAMLTGFASLLLVGAYTNSAFVDGTDEHVVGDRGSVPVSIREGGPIIDTTNGSCTSYRLPDKTIALTFDDGPDETWTPAVLDVLRKYRVQGTFFVLGARVAQLPDVTRRLVREGNELGLHTFTHPDLAVIGGWQRRIELSLTQLAIAGVTGRTTSLLREPYSSGASSLDDSTWSVVRESGALGYLTVVADEDSRDWDAPDVPTIVRSATPDGDRGAVVLWHDAGGDRSRTVAALDRYIPLMQSRGYRFTTVSGGLQPALDAATDQGAGAAGQRAVAAGSAAASTGVRLRGVLVVWTVRLSNGWFHAIWLVFVGIGVLTVVRIVALFVFAGHHAHRRRVRRSWSPRGDHPPRAGSSSPGEPVTIVVPAYNEAKGIANAVRSLATGDHPVIEVIVVDDGSTDGTATVVEDLRLPNVRVVRTPNSGKPSALNTGIARASHELIIMVDGDTVFEPGSIGELVKPFADPRVGAVAGNVKIGNRGSLLASWQHIEYVVGFNLDRRMYDTLRSLPTIPGAIGAFRRSALRDVGGVSADTLAEDTDLTMSLCRAGWRVVYQETARAWTEAPATLGQLWRQRYRWSYGTMQAMWKHRGAVRERSLFGLVGLPTLALFGVVLPLLAPLFDVLAVYGMFALDGNRTLVAWATMLVVQAVAAAFAFRLDGERLRALWAFPLQQFVYRQVMYLVAIKSMATAVTGARLRWHKLRRTGISLSAPLVHGASASTGRRAAGGGAGPAAPSTASPPVSAVVE